MKITKPSKLMNVENVAARPTRDFVFGYGTNKVDATPSAFKLVFTVSTYVDYEGLIQLTKVKMRQLLNVKPAFFVRTLESAKLAGFIEERNGKLYSLVHTFEKSAQFDYVQNYSRLVNGKFPSIGKWAMKLFAYIMGAQLSGFLPVKIENLYRNELHTADNGLDYFPDARSVVNSLVTLLKHDLIHIEFPSVENKKRIVLDNKNIKKHCKLLEEYVGILNQDQSNYSSSRRKKRTSSMKAKNHVLFIRLSKSVTESTEKVRASREELGSVLEDHNYSIGLLSENTIISIIGIKNALYKAAGSAGLSVYRKSLTVFLKEKFPLIGYYEQKKYQIYNHFMNYYVLSSIQQILLQVAKDIKAPTVQNSDLPNQFINSFGKMSIEEVKGLLKFFNKNSSRNHIVVLEKLLVDMELDLHSLRKTNMPWNDIFYKASDIRNNFLVYENVQLLPHEMREFTYELATKNLLYQEEKYREYLSQFKNSLNFHDDDVLDAWGSSSGSLFNQTEETPKKIQFYNWLEDLG